MDKVLLRTLTRKSKLNISGTKDKTVQELLDKRKTSVLISAYYRLDHINYQEDILKELKIEGELVIKKPGSNKELFDKVKHDIFGFKVYKKKKPFKLERDRMKR